MKEVRIRQKFFELFTSSISLSPSGSTFLAFLFLSSKSSGQIFVSYLYIFVFLASIRYKNCLIKYWGGGDTINT